MIYRPKMIVWCYIHLRWSCFFFSFVFNTFRPVQRLNGRFQRIACQKLLHRVTTDFTWWPVPTDDHKGWLCVCGMIMVMMMKMKVDFHLWVWESVKRRPSATLRAVSARRRSSAWGHQPMNMGETLGICEFICLHIRLLIFVSKFD